VKIGTKSLLFGCHQFLWHPITVAIAYRRLFKRWPDAVGWLCIAVHDIGYWGCEDIDGEKGKLHPLLGAKVVSKIVYRFRRWFCGESKLASALISAEAAQRCLFHSGSLAKLCNETPSDICWADKFSIFCEPAWFYLFRITLSGEVKEFVAHGVESKHVPAGCPPQLWLYWFKDYLCSRNEIFSLLQSNSAVREQLLLRYNPRVLKGWTNQFEKTNRDATARTHANGTSN
jgi:hypothetical protein